MSNNSRPRTAADYMIACICPMGVELAPVEAMLDEIHDPLVTTRMQNVYTLGKIGHHNIVVAVMPLTGTNAAATVATQLLNDFPFVRFGLLVGIGGGVPGVKDIRLGDVVVSQANGALPGVIQYDLGKRLEGGGFERTGSLNRPPAVLSASVHRLNGQHRRKGHQLSVHISQMLHQNPRMQDEYSLCATGSDDLFLASYPHQSGDQCRNCDRQRIVQRPQRPRNESYIHYGTIGSANVVVKNASLRDELSKDMEILCLEMEAAGLMNDFPCLVIRGICDYADSHKNKQWQPYAAAVAAAYMKELLLTIPALQVTETQAVTEDPARSADQAQQDAHAKIDREILASLAFPQMRDRQLNVQPPHPDTCRWILDLENYRQWHSRQRGLLWIKGKPGSGKSTIMSFLYEKIYDQAPAALNTGVRLEFFFSARGAHLQRSTIGMLRSLLCQLFQQHHAGQIVIRKYYQNKQATFGQQEHLWEWQQRELESLLLESVIASALNQDVSLFVDALDEAGQSVAHMIAEYFHTMDARAAATSTNVKICISCRHYPVVLSGRGIEIHVEKHNNNDITMYVRDRLRSHIPGIGQDSRLGQLDQITAELIQRSNGVFQWIRIVMSSVEKCIAEGMPMKEIRHRIQQVPDEISQMYENILLNVVDHEYRSQSFLLFQWVYLAQKPLSVKELRYALAANDARPQSRLSPVSVRCHETDGFIGTDDMMKRRIGALSGGLLEVTHEKVQVGHQTINEFLLQRGLALLENNSFPPRKLDPALVVNRCHATLFWSCLNYLDTEEQAVNMCKDLESARQWQERNLWDNLSFAEYAARYVFIHAAKAEPVHLQSIPIQVESMQRVLASWTFAKATRPELFLADPEKDVKVLHIAAKAMLFDVAVYLLERGDPVDLQTSKGRTALHYAAQQGHERMIKLLIDAGADPNITMNGGQTPLLLAAANGYLGSVRILMKHDENSGVSSDSVNEALVAACEAGHEHVVWVMLDAGANVNAPGNARFTALYAASVIGHEKLVRTLLDAGADVNASGKSHNTALYATIVYERERAVQILLHAGANVNASTKTQKTMLECALEGENQNIMQLLVDAGADVNVPTRERTTPLQYASSRGKTKIVQILIDAGANVNDPKDTGNTPLQIACRNGYEKIVRLLVNAGANIDVLGETEGTALHIASRKGYEKTVRLLINAGANIDVKGEMEDTALHIASRKGYEKIVRLLVDAGADVNALHIHFNTPLRAAASRGHHRVVQVLLEAGADANVQGRSSGTALQYACTYGYKKIVQMLLEAGADVNTPIGELGTALQHASLAGREEIVRLLLDAGADVNAPARSYGTALEAAQLIGSEEVVQILLGAGAKTPNLAS